MPLVPQSVPVGLVVEMDLPELGLTDLAWVTDVADCPEIESRDSGRSAGGSVVTATFHHSSGDVIDLPLGSKPSTLAPPEPIGTTSNHPFWSVDRQEYVQAGQLDVGERVLTFSGDTKRVVTKLPRPGPQPVYNLEVHDEHVYYVGEDAVLVHNAKRYFVPKGARPDGVDFEGTVWRYEYPGRLEDTWTASKPWNVDATHRYTKEGIGGAYAGLTRATAKHEVASYGALAGRVPTRKTVRLTDVLDLRDLAVQRQLGVTLDDIVRTTMSHGSKKYSITHVIGEWAKKQGYNGIIAPSAQFRGTPKRANLISFEDL